MIVASETVGSRLAALRRRRNMHQRQLADDADVSVDTIRKLEQGQRLSARLETLTRLARALDVQVSDLVGKPRGLVVGAEDSEMLHLRRAVFDVAPALDDPPALTALRTELGDVWELYWAGRYAPLARQLPAGIAAARARVRASAGGPLRRAQAVLADFLHLTASVLAHLSHDDLAALAMHQALAAAQATEDPLMVAGLSASRAWMLSRQGLHVEAEHLALATAAEIEPRMSTATVDHVALWGENLRYATVALARAGRHSEAAELLKLLHTAAARVGAERVARPWTGRVLDKAGGGASPIAGLSFGPTLAAMTAVTIAVAAGRHRQALRMEVAVPAFDSVSPAMRSRHLLTVAWAQMVDYRSTEAVHTLLGAEALAPQMLPHQTIARSITAELLHRRHAQRLPGLTGLAGRMGIDAH